MSHRRTDGDDNNRQRKPLKDVTNSNAPEKKVGQKSKREEGRDECQSNKRRHTMTENDVVLDIPPQPVDLRISEAEAIDVGDAWREEDQKKMSMDVVQSDIDYDSSSMDLSGTLGQLGEDDSKEFSVMGLGSFDANSNFMNTSLAEEQEEEEEEEDKTEDENSINNSITNLTQLPGVDDIDAADGQDPAWVTDYVKDVYKNLRTNENRNKITDYLSTLQTAINAEMRGILADWLVEVSEEYNLTSETLFLTISYIDRFLTRVPVERNQFQLVGITAMLVASKFEEVTPPSINDFVVISADTYKRSDIVDMEIVMLNALSFQLVAATPKAFVRRFLKAATADVLLACLANYLIELTLSEYWYAISVLPSTIAAAAVCLGLLILGREPWTPTLEHHTGYTFADESFSQCVCQLYLTFKRAPYRRQKAVVEKYRQPKFLKVSLITAPDGLLGESN